MSALTLFEVPVTTPATVTTFVTVAAASVEAASDKALDHVRSHGGAFVLDEDSIHWNDAYLPDPYGGTEYAQDPLKFRGVDEFPVGLCLVFADRDKRRHALLLNGRILKTADRSTGESLEELADNLADAMGTVWRGVSLIQESDKWEWDEIISQLTEFAPTTESRLCDELSAFCDREGLPQQSADELLCDNLTAAQEAWLKRFMVRWEAGVNA